MLNHDVCYAALQRRDPGYDGVIFVGVRTTGIYCRPICPARTPFSRNVTFYPSAALAQGAGFRPCLRCRPESAPDSPAWLGSLTSVNRALRLIDEGVLVDTSVDGLAAKLGVTGRHLRRLFVRHLGIGPLAVEQTRRINLAMKLLHETGLPMTQIAFASGFRSLRRFNEAFLALFDRPPTTIRRDAGAPRAAHVHGPVRLRLAYRPPFDLSRRLAESAASPPGWGDRIDGNTLRACLPMDGETARMAISQGPGNTLILELEAVPIRHLARTIVHVKRRFLSDAGVNGYNRGGDPVTRRDDRRARRWLATPQPSRAPAADHPPSTGRTAPEM